MINYSVTVITSAGKMTKVELTAKNDKEARRLAKKHGTVIVLSVNNQSNTKCRLV